MFTNSILFNFKPGKIIIILFCYKIKLSRSFAFIVTILPRAVVARNCKERSDAVIRSHALSVASTKLPTNGRELFCHEEHEDHEESYGNMQFNEYLIK